MKTIYLDFGMGATKNMIMAALLELHPDPCGFMKRLNCAGVPGVTVDFSPAVRCGVTGTGIWASRSSAAPHGGHGKTPGEIAALIRSLSISERAKRDAIAVYDLLARAECRVHGVPMKDIHFHEIGELTSVAVMVGACMLMDELAPSRVMASPLNVGGGTVRCSHGIMPVPAPATGELIRGIPVFSRGEDGELTTPSGAALVKYYVKSFGPLPALTVSKTGYGMGRDMGETLCAVRAYLGRKSPPAAGSQPTERARRLRRAARIRALARLKRT